MKRLFIYCIVVFECCTNTLHAQTIDISAEKNFEIINRHITIRDSANKKIVHLDAKDGIGIAWINKLNFATGTIEFDVKGKDVLQQSFVGIAFHGVNDSSYDAIYFRPFNFNSTNTLRKKHCVQYISMPQYDWQSLRQNFPLKYEHPITQTIESNSWFHAKIVVKTNAITVFVNNDANASLTVEPLNKYTSGKIGFWVGTTSDGDFSNLTINKE